MNDAQSPALPFARYRGGGRVQLGLPGQQAGIGGGDTNARSGYALAAAREAGFACQYCGFAFDTYERWLNLSLDHVVPQGTRQSPNVDPHWLDDLANCVPACRACNEFLNQYAVHETPTTWDEFLALRDRVFVEKKALALRRHETERATWQRLRDSDAPRLQ